MVLNPYTVYGKPGMLVAAFFVVYAVAHKLNRRFILDFVIPGVVLLVVGFIGAISSLVHGIPQFNHPKTALSLLVMFVAAYGMVLFAKRNRLSTDNILRAILFVVVFNSIIIILELEYDSLRQLIESYLDPLGAYTGSINYAIGYRFRGVASSGGAGLSISIPAAVIIALHLFNIKRLSVISLLIVAAVLIFSAAVIGRTGIILLAVPLSVYIIYRSIFRTNNLKHFVYSTAFCLLLIITIPRLYEAMVGYFTNMFGERFIKYSFGFLLKGSHGLQEEGTVARMIEFITVLPHTFPETLVGYGFYGGSFFDPWTDSGYSRMFMSVGYLYGLLSYFIIFRIYIKEFSSNKMLIGSFVLLLAIAEIKEPLLFSGVASRMFILVLISCYMERYTQRLQAND